SGLKEGDIILSIDGVKTKTVPQLQELVARYRPGNKLTIEYFRSGQKYKVDLILKNRLNNTDVVKFDRIFLDLGFEARDLTPAEKKEFKSGGLKIISITRGGIIDRTNMDAGFIVTKINEKEVTDLQGFTTYLKSLKGKVMLEGFYDTYPGEYYYAFKLE
nr:PDZ domain-containing protein [Saprospiraceae bacterium]